MFILQAGHIQINAMLPPENVPPPQSLENVPLAPSLPVDDLISQLDRSVMLQVKAVPRFPQMSILPSVDMASLSHDKARVAILFSGGIDSTVLAFLAHRSVQDIWFAGLYPRLTKHFWPDNFHPTNPSIFWMSLLKISARFEDRRILGELAKRSWRWMSVKKVIEFRTLFQIV
jgi:asparagine synthetase B (glutamine-hydrolysing)